MPQGSWLLAGLVVALTGFLASTLVLFLKYLQRTWNQQAEEFVKKDLKEVQRVIRESTSNMKRTSALMRQMEARSDELQYRLLILQDLAEAASLFAEKAPIDEQSFRHLITNFVLAATQSLLPTYQNTRARLMIMQQGKLVQYAAYVPEGAVKFSGSSFEPDEGAVGTCYAAGKAVIVQDSWADPLLRDRHKPPYRSVLCVPVPATGDKRIGVLNVDAPDTNYFNEDHATLLATVANILYPMWQLQFQNIGNSSDVMYNRDRGRGAYGKADDGTVAQGQRIP